MSLLAKLGLNSDQLNYIMKTIVNQGSIVKSEEDARIIIGDLALFELQYSPESDPIKKK